jgi:glutamate synthase (ferredoxin)
MIAEGCVMARVCHLNTCPVGVTSQKEELRKKFPGTPEHVVSFFQFVAMEVRELLAHMGYTSMDEVIGRADLLSEDDMQISRVAKSKVRAPRAREIESHSPNHSSRAQGLKLAELFGSIPSSKEDRAWLGGDKGNRVHVNGASSALDRELCADAAVSKVIADNAGSVEKDVIIYNTDRRCVGASEASTGRGGVR